MSNNRRMFIFLILLTGFGYFLGYIFKDEFSIIIKNDTNKDIKNISLEFIDFDSSYELEYLEASKTHKINLKELISQDKLKNKDKLNMIIKINDENYELSTTEINNIKINIIKIKNQLKVEIER